ncbi:hypothetical protein HanRHA438_Chr11g0530151 [Helianthus annuus]|nr:hypothetical protein HanRHA438_Chr11g0530151 [Helianthus annuus]
MLISIRVNEAPLGWRAVSEFPAWEHRRRPLGEAKRGHDCGIDSPREERGWERCYKNIFLIKKIKKQVPQERSVAIKLRVWGELSGKLTWLVLIGCG